MPSSGPYFCPHGGSSSLLLSWSGLCSQVAPGLKGAGMRMMFSTSVGLLRRDHSPWESVHLFQTINTHSTLHVAIKISSFLKNEAALPKVLELWSNDPCILLCIAVFHGCSQDVEIYVVFPVVHCLWTCRYVVHPHMSCGHCHFLCGFPRALLLPCLLLSYSSQSAQSRAATAVCALSPYCSTLYRAGHALAPAHEVSSLNLCPSHLHPQPVTEQKSEDLQPFLAWKVSLGRSTVPLMLFYSLCE